MQKFSMNENSYLSYKRRIKILIQRYLLESILIIFYLAKQNFSI